ncbi:MAG: M23 family metallopeptidase, partial [Kiritimatiellae bacterium]|nr:M23 family metallopeptidase [Kiritimatiellia bacterium]
RTGATGKPRFHEGVDIAATSRDRRGRPADPIFAVADGRVAFVNRSPGASSYGMYIVLEHPDPSLGVRTNASGCVTSVVYTLYAHLSDIAFGVRPGATVEAGEKIATMGTTSNTRPPIPNERGHLHWEVGLLLNSRYDRQSRELKNGNMFGLYNGQNLFGLDPLRVWKTFRADPDLSMRDYLFSHPVACTVLLRGRFPDFFTRNPGLWDGPPPDGTPIRIDLSESGCPLRGRNATDSELVVLGNARHAVLKADPAVLGRNARAYIRKKPSGAWEFTDAGRAWATALFYN